MISVSHFQHNRSYQSKLRPTHLFVFLPRSFPLGFRVPLAALGPIDGVESPGTGEARLVGEYAGSSTTWVKRACETIAHVLA